MSDRTLSIDENGRAVVVAIQWPSLGLRRGRMERHEIALTPDEAATTARHMARLAKQLGGRARRGKAVPC